MKVVTDQGTVITNGSLSVTQSGNLTNGEGAIRHYCISMGDVNGTGYLRLGAFNQPAGRTLITSGYYNVTLVAGYEQRPGTVAVILATIPSIQVSS